MKNVNKDKFCPFMSKERKDGMINKVDCSKRCALYTEDGCGVMATNSSGIDPLEFYKMQQALTFTIPEYLKQIMGLIISKPD